MQKINLEINKADVYEEVAKTTAYIGGKNVDANGKSLYDQVFVTDADKQMLERFWHGAIDGLTVILESVLRASTMDEESVLYNLGMTDNFPMMLEGSLKSTAIDYVVNQLIAEWCAVSAKGEVEKYSNEAGALLMQVNNLIHKRMRPSRNF